MDVLLNRQFDLKKTEFWFVTVLYVFAIFFLVSRAVNSPYYHGMDTRRFDNAHVLYSYYSNYLIPKAVRYTTLYAGFLLVSQLIVPALVRKDRVALNLVYAAVVFVLAGIVFAITDTWLRAYLIAKYYRLPRFYNALFKENLMYIFWLMMLFAFYSAVKYSATYILLNTDKVSPKYQTETRECAYAVVLWMIVMLMLMGNTMPEITGLWGMIVPFSIGLYWYSFYRLVPQSLSARKRFLAYLWRVIVIVAIGSIPMSFIIMVIYNDADAMLIVLFNAGFQLLITAPLAWQVYKRRQLANTEIYQLKTKLGRSNADLDFLKSQINPHFLFNSLNTLYGTALHENSEQTANGIQRLGDMMRFMLHENHQDRILLAREIDYMRNYINLQLLRTQASPDIRVEANIEDPKNDKQIAPMLLIPFVENAFKHGISLAKPSYIKMTLFSNDKELYFDVYNSIHPKAGEDPEGSYSGIGLENVKQRLNLLYPERHKLIIRETAKEYFVHLTIQF